MPHRGCRFDDADGRAMVIGRVCVAVVIDVIVPQLPTLSSPCAGRNGGGLEESGRVWRKFRKVGVEKI